MNCSFASLSDAQPSASDREMIERLRSIVLILAFIPKKKSRLTGMAQRVRAAWTCASPVFRAVHAFRAWRV